VWAESPTSRRPGLDSNYPCANFSIDSKTANIALFIRFNKRKFVPRLDAQRSPGFEPVRPKSESRSRLRTMNLSIAEFNKRGPLPVKKRLLRFSVMLTFCLLAAGTSLRAQDTASITGTVTDPSGAAIPGASVTVSSPDRGISHTAKTNGSGDYLFAALPIGNYNIQVAAKGFKKYAANDVVLDVGQKARADVALQVGAESSEVTVVGTNVAQVQTESSELSGTVSGKEISQLQLNGRNFTQLVTLVPGVSNQTGQDEGQVGVAGNVSYSINGGRTEYNNWELDGGDNMDNGSNTTLNVYPSLDAIGEFTVLTSNYGAQYGRNGSGTVEVETKSGTKDFHGDAYEFNRNTVYNARNYFQTSVQERFRLHHRRPSLHSARVQHQQAEDFFLLVGRVAA